MLDERGTDRVLIFRYKTPTRGSHVRYLPPLRRDTIRILHTPFLHLH